MLRECQLVTVTALREMLTMTRRRILCVVILCGSFVIPALGQHFDANLEPSAAPLLMSVKKSFRVLKSFLRVLHLGHGAHWCQEKMDLLILII